MMRTNKEKNPSPPIWERFFQAIGIFRSSEHHIKFYVTRRFFRFLGMMALGLIFSFFALFEFSTSPLFCNSCHIMKPYYDAWKTSSHNMVPCVDCHYPPELKGTLWVKYQALSQVAKYVTRTYSTKAYAEIDDASCLRMGCHNERLLIGNVTFKKNIIFDHTPHLTKLRRGKKLRCTSCHSQIVQGDHMSVTEDVCFLCHFKGYHLGRREEVMHQCRECHTQIPDEVTFRGERIAHKDYAGNGVPCEKCHYEVIQGTGEVDRHICTNCHGEKERLEKFGETKFLHKNHVTDHKVECYHCHSTITHKVKTSVAIVAIDCHICHKEKHAGPKEMYSGTGARGVPDSPSMMWKAHVDCIGCHFIPDDPNEATPFQGETFRATKSACVACHDPDLAELLDIWKQEMKEAIERAERLFKKAKRLYISAKDRNDVSVQVQQLYRDAEFNLNFVKYSNGVHNIEYAMAILEDVEKDSKKMVELLKK